MEQNNQEELGQVILKDLFEQISFKEIWNWLRKYLLDEIEEMQQPMFLAVYSQLQQIKPNPSQYNLRIDANLDNNQLKVLFVGADYRNVKIELAFSLWADWLGLNVTEELIDESHKILVCALCLYAMTSNGFAEEDILHEQQRFISETNEMVEN